MMFCLACLRSHAHVLTPPKKNTLITIYVCIPVRMCILRIIYIYMYVHMCIMVPLYMDVNMDVKVTVTGNVVEETDMDMNIVMHM